MSLKGGYQKGLDSDKLDHSDLLVPRLGLWLLHVNQFSSLSVR